MIAGKADSGVPVLALCAQSFALLWHNAVIKDLNPDVLSLRQNDTTILAHPSTNIVNDGERTPSTRAFRIRPFYVSVRSDFFSEVRKRAS